VALVDLNVVRGGTPTSIDIDIGGHDARVDARVPQHHGDRPRTRAQIDGDPAWGQELDSSPDDQLGLATGNIHAPVHTHPVAHEHRRSDEPFERLAVSPAADPGLPDRRVTRASLDHLTDLFTGGREASPTKL
jgi:hypothetical protein